MVIIHSVSNLPYRARVGYRLDRWSWRIKARFIFIELLACNHTLNYLKLYLLYSIIFLITHGNRGDDLKILVLSDSHNNIKNMQKVVEKLKEEIDIILHLGDCSEDISKFNNLPEKVQRYSVIGNCDFINREPEDLLLNLDGINIFMTHGHRYQVKWHTDSLIYKAMEKEADICLFGHTHCPTCYREKNILIMNPGSISLPRGYAHPTFGIINIEAGKAEGAVFALTREGVVPAKDIKRY